MKYKTFGQRFCTHCGTYEMYYFEDEDGEPGGMCLRCGNIDWCDNQTIEDVKQHYGEKLLSPKKKFIVIK